VWSYDNGFVQGIWKPPSFLEKLLSGDGIEVTENLARVLVAKPWRRVKKSPERDLVIGKQYS
jgi:hypothetical protein